MFILNHAGEHHQTFWDYWGHYWQTDYHFLLIIVFGWILFIIGRNYIFKNINSRNWILGIFGILNIVYAFILHDSNLVTALILFNLGFLGLMIALFKDKVNLKFKGKKNG